MSGCTQRLGFGVASQAAPAMLASGVVRGWRYNTKPRTAPNTTPHHLSSCRDGMMSTAHGAGNERDARGRAQDGFDHETPSGRNT